MNTPKVTSRIPSAAVDGKSVVVIKSRLIKPEDFEGAEETEIAAQITLPQEGGWGWMVIFGSFWSIFILDGTALTYGSMFRDISEDLAVSDSLVAFINSTAIALYLLAGPLASALINRFGFRTMCMTGSIICCFSLVCTYFSTNYATICLFYGVIAGFGYCLINLASCLIVGFYFEKLRAFALALATSGSSVGISIMFPVNSHLVKIAGWRVVVLLHSGLFGLVFFLGMTFKPLLSLTVRATTDSHDPTKTVTYLPNISTAGIRAPASHTEGLVATATERLFSAVSNVNFPTAANVIDEMVVTTSTQPGQPGQPGQPSQPGQPGTSTAAVSRLTITAQVPQGGMTPRQLKQVQSIMSRTSVADKSRRVIVEAIPGPKKPKKRKCWARFCNWEEDIPQSRPLYRDDAFYEGKLENLAVYQKSVMDTSANTRTGLEYQLAVSRAVTTMDLKEKRGIFTTAVRRILATMMDPHLLTKKSFLLLCSSGMAMYVGYLIPYVFIQDRNRDEGIAEYHCNFYVTSIGIANTAGRLVLGLLATKVDALKVFIVSCVLTGVGTLASNLYFDAYYQYFCCCIFGFFVAGLACLRSMVLVELYGLEKLTNATGMMLLFQGLGSLVSTPIASTLKNSFGFSSAFYFAGSFMFFSGLLLIPLKLITKRESKDNKT